MTEADVEFYCPRCVLVRLRTPPPTLRGIPVTNDPSDVLWCYHCGHVVVRQERRVAPPYKRLPTGGLLCLRCSDGVMGETLSPPGTLRCANPACGATAPRPTDPPLVAGGQGRSGEENSIDGRHVAVLAGVAFVVVVFWWGFVSIVGLIASWTR